MRRISAEKLRCSECPFDVECRLRGSCIEVKHLLEEDGIPCGVAESLSRELFALAEDEADE